MNRKNFYIFIMAAFFLAAISCTNPESDDEQTSSNTSDGYTEEEKLAAQNAFYAQYANFRCVDKLDSYSGSENPSFPIENAFGLPLGKGETSGSLDVFIMGEKNEAIFYIDGKKGFNGSGSDLVIFENGFKSGEYTYYYEPGFIEVSPNGVDWYGFEPVFGPDSPNLDVSHDYNELSGKTNLVGLKYVRLNYLEDVLDPSLEIAGGDRFDFDYAKKITDRSSGDPLTYTYSSTLATDGFDSIKYIKISDGYVSDTIETALSSDPNPRNGIDIDAICFYHTIDD